MQNFVHGMLHGSPAALRIETIWKVSPASDVRLNSFSFRTDFFSSSQEYEEGETHEARFVKGLSSALVVIDDFLTCLCYC